MVVAPHSRHHFVRLELLTRPADCSSGTQAPSSFCADDGFGCIRVCVRCRVDVLVWETVQDGT